MREEFQCRPQIVFILWGSFYGRSGDLSNCGPRIPISLRVLGVKQPQAAEADATYGRYFEQHKSKLPIFCVLQGDQKTNGRSMSAHGLWVARMRELGMQQCLC